MSKFKDMRPSGIYESVLDQREIDGIKFYKENSKKFVDVDCPACGSNLKRLTFNKWGYNHYTCQECETLFCSPRPKNELLGHFYNSYEAPKMWTNLLINTDVNRKQIQYTPRVQRLLKLIGKSDKEGIAIDVGAGSGAFALSLKTTDLFDDVIALDISDDCVRTCKGNGLNAIKGEVSDLKENSYDLICMNDLIEHVYDPFKLLSDCYKVIKDDGFIQIATPNGEGFDFKILREETKNITPPEHINYFNTDSIKRLLEKIGFKDIIVETPGILDVDIISNEVNKGLNLGEKNEYLSYLLGRGEDVRSNFQRFLAENKLSSHMLIVAKK